MVRILRRQDDRLGRAPQRHRPVGPRHRRHRPGRGHGRRRRSLRRSRTATTATPTSPSPTRYADGTRLVTTSDGENGNRFIGDKGWIFVSRGRIEASDPKLIDEPLPAGRRASSTSRTNHMEQLPRRRPDPQAADLRRRDRPPLGHRLPHRRDRASAGKPLQWDPKPSGSSAPAPTATRWSPARCGRPGSSRSERLTESQRGKKGRAKERRGKSEEKTRRLFDRIVLSCQLLLFTLPSFLCPLRSSLFPLLSAFR